MKKALAAAMTMVAAGAVSVSAMGGTVSAAEDCLAETYSWNNTSITSLATWNPTISTGISIPAPVGNEHIAVIGTSWSAYDRLMEENPEVTRENPEENGERFTVAVGGTQVGGATADLPDTAAEGAPTPWFSGVISGQLGGIDMDVPGGAITIRHAGSGSGFDAFIPKTVTITVVRCTPPVTTQAPTTTVVSSGGPTTTAPSTPTTPTTPTAAPTAPTTPSVAAGGPTTTVSTSGSGGSLPTTGGDMTLPLILAALAAGTGTVLLMVRRKASSH